MKFNEMKYERPAVEAALAAAAALKARAGAVGSDAEMVQLFRDIDEAESHWSTMARLANIRYTLDTRDPVWSAEQEFLRRKLPGVLQRRRRRVPGAAEKPLRFGT
jgi:hypothetical protein